MSTPSPGSPSSEGADPSSRAPRKGRREALWKAPSGRYWSAILILEPGASRNEVEIQVESEGSTPERILCTGPLEEWFSELSREDLELVRRAARSRQGVLWLDSRDGQLWWVTRELRSYCNWLLTYSNARWTAVSGPHPTIPIALLENRDHRRFLDEALRSKKRRVRAG